MTQPFALSETEFVRRAVNDVAKKVALEEHEGNEHYNPLYKDFCIEVFTDCHHGTNKGYTISALLFVEVEISHLQTQAQRDAVNKALTDYICKALALIRSVLANIKNLKVELTPEEEILRHIDLQWSDKKVALVELGYALKVAKCFGTHLTVKDIVQRLAKAFNVEISDHYIYKKYNEIRVRGGKDGVLTEDGDKSRTYFLDLLASVLNAHMRSEDIAESPAANH